ncbi:MAG: lysine-2,3-aminomutase-like protein [Acetobacteraceae bacterium]|nr:lysine-2,3-aminomutase-like protein [Acetobacteraceae bacterium]
MIRDIAGLVDAGLAAPGTLDAVGERYAVAITDAVRALIHNPADPIGLQFVPDPAELDHHPHELADPIGDAAHSPLPGLVHRYPDRVLLKPVLVCPVYCRFCFRREHVGPGAGAMSPADVDAALDYIATRPAIREVILTGGDPLMLAPRRLAALLDRLEAIPQVELLRLHSRVPVTDPARVTPALLAALDRATPVWLAVHVNHEREFSPAAAAALRALHAVGVALLGQSVLLRGVNDDVSALEDLFRAMLRARIKPYYLHQLDPAPGTARFHVPIEEGRRLLEALRGRVTGLAWPTYVLDIAGGHGKVPIGPDYLDGTDIRDPWGGAHTLAGACPPV